MPAQFRSWFNYSDIQGNVLYSLDVTECEVRHSVVCCQRSKEGRDAERSPPEMGQPSRKRGSKRREIPLGWEP